MKNSNTQSHRRAYCSMPFQIFVPSLVCGCEPGLKSQYCKHEVYGRGVLAQTVTRNSQRQKLCALCPTYIMVDLDIEHASVNLTVTTSKADTVNPKKKKSWEKSFITSFTYGTLRCPVMKHSTNISLCHHLTQKYSVT